MLKIYRFVRRRPDLTMDEFKNYWLTKHAQFGKLLAEKTPVRKITASFTKHLIAGKESPFDGMAEIYYDSFQDLQASQKSGLYVSSGMQKDEENFADLTTDLTLVLAEEYVVAEKTKE